jgi:peptidoglycan/xylan/chitin deacetylase (PgdA/CDA1 family)
MGILRVIIKKVARPQVAVGLAGILVVGFGYMAAPKIIRPTVAAEVPVIQPIEAQVEGIAVSRPVDCSRDACIALTFDDGPDPEVTPRVLDTLRRYNAKATFFLYGERVPGNRGVVRRIHLSGHEIGNHTWSHRKLSELSPREIEADIARAQNAITAAGAPAPSLFRPPYGDFNVMVRSHIAMTVVAWNIDPEDWKATKPQQVVDRVLKNAKPGAIIDLHDTYRVTADALDPILADLSQKYHLVTVSEMLNLPAGQPGVFYGR